MNARFQGLLVICSCFTVLLTTVGCTVKATTKTTTDGVVNVLSSTSGHSWYTEDGLVKQDQKVQAFTAMNADNLQQDVAAGRGEYLASLGTLLGVPPERQEGFSAHAQQNYEPLFLSNRSEGADRLSVLTQGFTSATP